jgi:hypothetical protein
MRVIREMLIDDAETYVHSRGVKDNPALLYRFSQAAFSPSLSHYGEIAQGIFLPAPIPAVFNRLPDQAGLQEHQS